MSAYENLVALPVGKKHAHRFLQEERLLRLKTLLNISETHSDRTRKNRLRTQNLLLKRKIRAAIVTKSEGFAPSQINTPNKRSIVFTAFAELQISRLVSRTLIRAKKNGADKKYLFKEKYGKGNDYQR